MKKTEIIILCRLVFLIFILVGISCQKEIGSSIKTTDEEVYFAINKSMSNFDKIFTSPEFKSWKNPSEANYVNLDSKIREAIETESITLRSQLVMSPNSEHIISKVISDRSNRSLHSLAATPWSDKKESNMTTAGATFLGCLVVSAATTGMVASYLCHVALAVTT